MTTLQDLLIMLEKLQLKSLTADDINRREAEKAMRLQNIQRSTEIADEELPGVRFSETDRLPIDRHFAGAGRIQHRKDVPDVDIETAIGKGALPASYVEKGTDSSTSDALSQGSIGDVSKLIVSNFYSRAQSRDGRKVGVRDGAMIYGKPGIGKTQTVENTAKYLARAENRRFVSWEDLTDAERDTVIKNPSKFFLFVEIRATQYEPEEQRGIPEIQTDTESYINIGAKWMNAIAQPGAMGIVFLDEFNHADERQLQALHSFLDGKILERKFSDDVIVVAASNMKEAGTDVNTQLSTSLKDRFSAINMVVDYPTWREFANDANVSPRILGFLDYQYKIGNIAADGTSPGEMKYFYDDVTPVMSAEGKGANPRNIMKFNAALQGIIEEYQRGIISGDELGTRVLHAASTKINPKWAREFLNYFTVFNRYKPEKLLKEPISKVSTGDITALKVVFYREMRALVIGAATGQYYGETYKPIDLIKVVSDGIKRQKTEEVSLDDIIPPGTCYENDRVKTIFGAFFNQLRHFITRGEVKGKAPQKENMNILFQALQEAIADAPSYIPDGAPNFDKTDKPEQESMKKRLYAECILSTTDLDAYGFPPSIPKEELMGVSLAPWQTITYTLEDMDDLWEWVGEAMQGPSEDNPLGGIIWRFNARNDAVEAAEDKAQASEESTENAPASKKKTGTKSTTGKKSNFSRMYDTLVK